MTKEDLIIQTLHNSTLTEELRDAEIESLARIIEVKDYKAGDVLVQPGNDRLKNALIILASGEVEATANVGGEQAILHLLQPGDLAGIITFVGGNVAQISATTIAKTDSKVLVLERSKFESLLNTQPAIVYYVMRGIVRHTHGIVRRMNMQSVEMTNYIHQTGGRY
ncbi:Crp/Fnr family transcriptional regulator [Sideroxydans lithotrophicus]|jgi:CRP/FNR family cyclic AMP-dependent transcriptional regulator|uniref:Putative transcriptional regulator, Crp/Fnr family n=1 Tax=Sideroxydans lithotrophicus (strain ES-1) TaxID=580332 RepID=D5CP11_SIDLE|nr:cyclic nucleotide-binding domain-containing protein [Sideroxydans lithotrophicus]ADE12932.1 putative transcriptional regulator, Crp/Fnr family [Sideroxydans lithotrophicus ES-1]